MTKRLWTRGLPVLLLVALVSIGCSSYQPPPTEPPPDDNVCNWPEYCHPDTAHHMLTTILSRANADYAKQAIGQADLEIIEQEVQEGLEPGLKNGAGRHVCHLTGPLPCDELKQIFDASDPNNMPKTPAQRKKYWHTIATDLQNFPSGN